VFYQYLNNIAIYPEITIRCHDNRYSVASVSARFIKKKKKLFLGTEFLESSLAVRLAGNLQYLNNGKFYFLFYHSSISKEGRGALRALYSFTFIKEY